jgi:hypothetical protein
MELVAMQSIWNALVALLLLVSLNVACLAVSQLPAQKTAQTTKSAVSASIQPDTKPGPYWFQIGAWAASEEGYGNMFGIPVTGASVEIQVNYNQHVVDPQSNLAYWVGINLPGDSFIQVGYKIDAQRAPYWFWEYFLHDASNPSGTCNVAVTCPTGDNIGPDDAWYKFSLESSGTIWSVFVNGAQVGSIDLGVSDSGTNGPYASAEVAGTASVHTILGPVAFRNLQYRDTSGQWHEVSAAVSNCCYSVGSDTYSGNYPYGVVGIPGENNEWMTGSDLTNPIQEQGDFLWPWYQVSVSNLPNGMSFQNGWYVYDSEIDLTNAPEIIPVDAALRYYLEGFYVNGALDNETRGFTVTQDLTIRANYVKQWYVQVNSNIGTPTGSGWYVDGTKATISINPAHVASPGLIGELGIGMSLSGWQGDYNGSVEGGESTIIVNSPMTVTAVWTTDYGVLPYFLLLLPCVFLLVYFRRKRRVRIDWGNDNRVEW